MKWTILILAILTNAAASVLVKYAVTGEGRSFPSLKDPVGIITNYPLIGGLTFYGIAFILYALALTRFPINIAHPVMTAGTITLIALSSVVLFREPFHWFTALGIALIMAGVVVLTMQVPTHG